MYTHMYTYTKVTRCIYIYVRQMPGLCPDDRRRIIIIIIRIKPLLKIFNECRSLTGVRELNPY